MLLATVTTAEAADILDTSEANVRQLVHRGRLRPVRPGAKPLRFMEAHVLDVRWERRPAAEQEWLRVAARLFALT